MIKEKVPAAMYEVEEMAEKLKETERAKEIRGFIKKFIKLSPEKSKKLKKDLEALDIIKLKTADIIKIIDVAPENAAELNKIFSEISLDSDETNKILEAIKSNK